MTYDLAALARDAMKRKGFEPEFPAAALAQVRAMPESPAANGSERDLRHLPWSSIDNDTTRDLDQLEYAEKLGSGRIRVLIGIAEVDARVALGTPIDEHAARQTTSVYTDVLTFPMLPERLSTELTSLIEGGDRLAIVIDMVVDDDGDVEAADAYPALVRNYAQLTYNAVGPWLEGAAPAPAKAAANARILEQLRLQDEAASLLRQARHRRGALEFDRAETRAVIENGKVKGRVTARKNRAGALIEDFMLAANQAMARTLREKGVSSIRRVVKEPERWDRIVALARQEGTSLPARPDVLALNAFLRKEREEDARKYADMSLAILKLLGPGEYAMERADDTVPDHFSLAARDYTHSTAPNRRFADIVTQRILKAALAGARPPYGDEELAAIARHCTLQEDAAQKVERLMDKRIAAVAMTGDIGREFPAIVTGVTPRGTFVKVFDPPAEGLLRHGEEGADVGDRIRVRLISVNVAEGFVDFARV